MMKLAVMTAGVGLTTIMAICHSWHSADAKSQIASALAPPSAYSVSFVEGAEAEPPAWPPTGPGMSATLEPAAGLSLASLDTTAPVEKPVAPPVPQLKPHPLHHHARNNITFAKAGNGAIVPIKWDR